MWCWPGAGEEFCGSFMRWKMDGCALLVVAGRRGGTRSTALAAQPCHPPPAAVSQHISSHPSSPCCRDGRRLGLWANGRGDWLVRDLACLPSRPTITYCDTAPQPAPYAHPAALRFGRAAGGEPADASLAWARFYSYALPEPDVPAEAAAAPGQLSQYFRLAAAAPLLACPPGSDECASDSKPGGLPLPMLAAAGAGGAVAVAAACGGCWWWRRRRARRQAAAAASLERSSAESGSSCKTVASA